MKLIPITYHSKKYPESIVSSIDEIAGNLDKEYIKPVRNYSLHTEYSHMPRKLDNSLINRYPHLKDCHKDYVPELWKDEEWAKDFAKFIIELIGNQKAPKIIEIHPPFDDYCPTFNDFFNRYQIFENAILEKYPDVNIFIENRCGTFYKGGKFLLSKTKSIVSFLEELQKRKMRLKLVLDYPQVFSAELIKMDNIKLEKIIDFNRNIKTYRENIGGFHLWGKKKSKLGRWTPHTGDLNTFFSNNEEMKKEFIKSIIDTFDDDTIRYFVPEVNSSEDDLQSIVSDLINYGIKFLDEI